MSLGIVSLDAATTTGYCVMVDGEVLLLGQCHISAVPDHIGCGYFAGVDWVLAVEKPFVGFRQSARSVISHAENCGRAVHMATVAYPGWVSCWRPLAKEWRSKLPGMPQSPATACKRKALEIARAAGHECRGPKGADQTDAAEAYCQAVAAGYWYYQVRK